MAKPKWRPPKWGHYTDGKVYTDENGMTWEDLETSYNNPNPRFRKLDLQTLLNRSKANRYSCSERGEYITAAEKFDLVTSRQHSRSDSTHAIITSQGDDNEIGAMLRVIVKAAALTGYCHNNGVQALYNWNDMQPEVHIKVAMKAAELGIIQRGRNTKKATLIARCAEAVAFWGTALYEMQPSIYRLARMEVIPEEIKEMADLALFRLTGK